MTVQLEPIARATLVTLAMYQVLSHADDIAPMVAETAAAYERHRRAQLLAELAGLLRARASIVERWQDAYFAGELDQ